MLDILPGGCLGQQVMLLPGLCSGCGKNKAYKQDLFYCPKCSEGNEQDDGMGGYFRQAFMKVSEDQRLSRVMNDKEASHLKS